MRKTILSIAFLFTLATPAFAEIHGVATLPWIGALAKEIGRDKVSITVLVKPSQDPHYVDAKPSMIRAANRADIFMYNGLDLEISYVPLIIRSSRNSKIQPGQKGNLDCSQYIDPIDRASGDMDRSMGDVHPLGNPHYHFSPGNMLKVAEGMAASFAELDHANADFYRANAAAFGAKLRERQKQWAGLQIRGKRFIAYHKMFEYLAADFGFRIIGYVEPKPGIPPSASHVERLVEDMKKARPDGILSSGVYGKKEVESLSTRTGVRVILLPNDVGAGKGTEDWFSFMDAVLASLK